MSFNNFLASNLRWKTWGSFSYFLGLEVSYDFDSYYLSEAKYAFDLFSRVELTDYNIFDSPLETHVNFRATYGKLLPYTTL